MSLLRAGESCKDRPVKINHKVVVLDAADLSDKAVFGLECSVARSTPRLWHMVVSTMSRG